MKFKITEMVHTDLTVKEMYLRITEKLTVELHGYAEHGLKITELKNNIQAVYKLTTN